MSTATTLTFTLLRLVVGFILFQAGATKIFGWFGGMPGAPGATVPFWSQVGIGGWLEILGGLALLLGLFTRPVAFVLSGMMAVAYWQFHAPQGTWPGQNGGLPAVLCCFTLLYMSARGGGDWSLDALVRSRRTAANSRPPA
jgi:putative oxidoreductase